MTLTPTPTTTPTPASAPTRSAKRRPSPAARRAGYLVAALVNVALLVAVHRWPGWETVPFLTRDTDDVLLALDLSLVAGVLVNLGHLVSDPRWLRGLGDMVTTAFSLAALVRIWTVFPFSYDGGTDWELVTRVLLGLGIAGTAIGFVAGLVAFVRASRIER